MKPPLVIILGTTAVGKTRLAVALAGELNGEIISADSRQIFRGMDIGTGKDLGEYQLAGRQIPFHLINIREAGEKYHVHAFQEDFFKAFTAISHKQKLPILCGGTGMYIHSILQNHELTGVPVNESLRTDLQHLSKDVLIKMLETFPIPLRAHADYSSAKRLVRAIEIAAYLSHHPLEKRNDPQFEPLVIGLVTETSVRRDQIMRRLMHRLSDGLIEEVQELLSKGVSRDMLNFYGLEYKFVGAYLNGELTKDSLKEKLGTAICQFAKRQQTFFRKMEKDGVQINWIPGADDFFSIKEKAKALIGDKFGLK